MRDSAGSSIVAILLAIIGVAVIAVILSNQSNTSNVISSSGSGFASALSCALSPITGSACNTSSNLLTSVTSTFTPL